MFSVNVLCAGGMKEQYLRAACDEYRRRLTPFCSLAERELHDDAPDGKFLSALTALPARTYRIALCIEGEQFSSERLAGLLAELPVQGRPGAVFVIGGAEGLGEQVKAACDLRLSFSRMTFTHQMMRVLLLEQIYRAFTINANLKYHK